MDNKFLNRQKAQSILNTRPQGTDVNSALKALANQGFTIEGYNDGSKGSINEKKKGIISNTIDTIKNVASERLGNIKEGFNEVGDAYNQEMKLGEGLKNQKLNAVEAGLGKALQQPLNVAGQLAGGFWDLAFKAAMSVVPEEIKKQGEQAISNFVANNESAQKVLQGLNTFQKENPDLARALENTLNVLPVKPATKVASKGIELGEQGIKKTVQSVDDLIRGVSDLTTETGGKLTAKLTPSTEKAVQNTYDGIMKQVENKSSLLKDFTKREGTGKDPIRVIAENPDYMIGINPEAKTFDVVNSVSNLSRDIKEYSAIRDNLLKTADESFGHLNTNEVINSVLNKVSSKSYKQYLDEGEKAVKQVINKLKSLKKFNPETISREELNNIRKSLDETINTFTNTKLQDKLRLDVRTAFKESLENSIPDNTLLKELNGKIGDLIDTSDFLTKKLAGSKVKGGGLTDLAIKTAGSQTGSVIGAGAGGILGGIPGAVAGYTVSDFLSKTLIKNAINNPFDRKVLQRLIQEEPEIITKVNAFIQELKNQGVKNTDKVLDVVK